MRAVRRVLARLFALTALVAVFTTAFVALQPAEVSEALSGSDFDASNIISDGNFYDSHAMSEADIQSFLQAKIGTCSNALCLNVLKVDTVSKSADNMCPGGYTGAAGEPASRVIYKVEQGCGISAKVILVTLQKEQTLVTSRGPSAAILQKAMGFGCPDTSVCNSLYYGFFNQVYQAARQLKRYGLAAPDNISFHYFPVGTPSSVKFNPNPVSATGQVCGSSVLTIQNKATAALYYYTPYQPNASALANLRGTGDTCGSYGNRNFWVFYNDWFGSPTFPPGTPDGEVYSYAPLAKAIRITGWAVDPDSLGTSVPVAVQVASAWYGTTANVADPNADQNDPGAGLNHGFDITVPSSPGLVRVCVTLVNTGGTPGSNMYFSCNTVDVPASPPAVGAIETATPGIGTIALSGWAVRPDALAGAVNVAAVVGTSWTQLAGGKPNATAPTKLSGAGPNQGFSGTVTAPPGVQTVCVWASPTIGTASQLGCSTVTVLTSPAPQGAIVTATSNSVGVTVTGWAVRPDAVTTSVPVAIQIGTRWIAASANQPSTQAQTAVPGSGANHGFTSTFAGPATSVCIWAAGTVGAAIQLGCSNVTVVAGPRAAVGAIDSVAGVAGGVSFAGWSVNPDAPTAVVPVAVNIGSAWIPFSTGESNAVAPTQVTGAGPTQGFSGVAAAAPGVRTACIWVSGSTGPVQLGCKTVTVPTAPAPVGAITTATAAAGSITFAGWVVRPDAPSATVPVAVNIGSRWIAFGTGSADAVAPTQVTGAGPNQGVTGTFTAPKGSQSFCIWAAPTAGPAINLGCKTVVVP